MVAKYVFLTRAVAVVEIVRFAAILPKVKSINEYDPEFALL